MIRELPERECNYRGYDLSEFDNFGIYSFDSECKHGYIHFEQNREFKKGANVLLVAVIPSERNKGIGKKMVIDFLSYAKEQNWEIDWGAFTNDGEKYIKPIIDKFQS